MAFHDMLDDSNLDRPDVPLIVKCVFDKSLRRITFASALTCRLETLRARIEDCFALGASSFFIAYTDDDGEETSIRSESDLTEAISYFDTGGDDEYSMPASSSASTYSSDSPMPGHSKVTLRVQVVVEYDGPSLSDTASIAETFDDRLMHVDTYEDRSESSWQSESSRGIMPNDGRYRRQSYRDKLIIPEEDEGSSTASFSSKPRRTPQYGHVHQPLSDTDSISHSNARGILDEPRRRRLSSRNRDQDESSHHTSLAARPHSQSTEWPEQSPPDPIQGIANLQLDIRGGNNRSYASPSTSSRISRTSTAPPSILTSSELGARWLREQNERVKKRVGPGPSGGGSRSSGLSMEEDHASDDDEASMYEEGRGDLALVRDRRGKWYYSYQTSDLASNADTEPEHPPSKDLNRLQRSLDTNTYFPARKAGKQAETYAASDAYKDPEVKSLLTGVIGPEEDEDTADGEEPAAPPFFAPDCSACGLRLDYMRYVCSICGEGHMWQEGQQEKQIVLEAQLHGVHGSDGASSGEAEWGRATIEARSHSSGASSSTVNENELLANRSGSPFIENPASDGSDASSTSDPSPPSTPVDDTDSQSPFRNPQHSSKLPNKAPHGYELCAGCIEIQGIAHSRAMEAVALDVLQGGSGKVEASTKASNGLSRRLGTIRHTYRELIWSAKGWKDIEYNDECHCSICNLELYQNRHKCVSCANFNLCRSCHQNAQEIHPAHCFLTVPDQMKRLKHAADRTSNSRNGQISKLVKHPGAFCHNCLQDIMGPRFHCAVCPSWDLCIQCEGIASTASGVSGTHTADHIMMKIPLPLASSEVEFVSRRARDRWTQQDSTAVSGSNVEPSPSRTSARSPSPTNETVYGGGNQVAHGRTNANGMVRDSLDHGVQCRGCNEWIMGRRYQCANCPSDPVPFNLCSLCELRSYKIHNPMHVFIKFDRPVHYPLQSPFPVLPPLYKIPVGQVRSVAPLDPRDPTAYLKCVQHTSTICDIHVGPIQGIWLRCAQCAVSFDICQECESVADHDPTHVFVVFKSEVDMPTFRSLAGLSATHSRPLIHQHIYL